MFEFPNQNFQKIPVCAMGRKGVHRNENYEAAYLADTQPNKLINIKWDNHKFWSVFFGDKTG